MNFAQICAFQWTLHDFWVQKCKINFLRKISVLIAAFIKLKCMWYKPILATWKTPATWFFLLMADFLNIFFFKKAYFLNFQIFWKSSAAHTKIIVCVLFHVNMFDKAYLNLIIPFSNNIFARLVSTSGFKVKLLLLFYLISQLQTN